MFKNILILFSSVLFVSCVAVPRDIKYAKRTKGYKINADYFPSINQDERVRYLILHYTVADDSTSLKILSGRTPREVSIHYLVNDKKDKKIHLLVDENKRAWHAGRSNWENVNSINFSSIGIEIVNKGYVVENEKMIFCNFPDYQIKKVAALAKNIIDRYHIKPENVIGHSDIAPERKSDPGPKFPWKRLYYNHNIGAWYDYSDKEEFKSRFPQDSLDSKSFILSVQQDLTKYGYKTEETGEWDEGTQKVITVFQHHFRPEIYDGILDSETWGILQALIKKYKSS